jgi:hypothetical protein
MLPVCLDVSSVWISSPLTSTHKNCCAMKASFSVRGKSHIYSPESDKLGENQHKIRPTYLV